MTQRPLVSTSIHLFDADRAEDLGADEGGVFPVQFYCDLIPRVGDTIHYVVEMSRPSFEDGEPGQIEGKVARVEIEYRRMTSDVATLVSVWLSDYKATPPNKRQLGQR